VARGPAVDPTSNLSVHRSRSKSSTIRTTAFDKRKTDAQIVLPSTVRFGCPERRSLSGGGQVFDRRELVTAHE
jgi:hypothetical protein